MAGKRAAPRLPHHYAKRASRTAGGPVLRGMVLRLPAARQRVGVEAEGRVAHACPSSRKMRWPLSGLMRARSGDDL